MIGIANETLNPIQKRKWTTFHAVAGCNIFQIIGSWICQGNSIVVFKGGGDEGYLNDTFQLDIDRWIDENIFTSKKGKCLLLAAQEPLFFRPSQDCFKDMTAEKAYKFSLWFNFIRKQYNSLHQSPTPSPSQSPYLISLSSPSDLLNIETIQKSLFLPMISLLTLPRPCPHHQKNFHPWKNLPPSGKKESSENFFLST